MLTVFIDEIFKEAGIKASQLDAVAVSKGPGSYTGLRIGVSVAKGIAYAASIPLIAIDTTLSMFYGVTKKSALYCPMLDARRMEVYYAIYNSEGNTLRAISAEIITKETLKDIPLTQEILLFGDGANKCRDVLTQPNIRYDDNFRISASHMYSPAIQALKEHKFEDVAYFEPFYLKDFITSTPKRNVLGK
jgi:tRNA threonylcarbamoyladenosine biosynthesis protein TsaB